ncbi:hypothetical protein QZM48_29760 [Burkholderia orbicola]|uniref:hypothetical protein n=1 Tax=Burkholderia cepacia complex TaxID=87882 RepID=UPI00098EDD8B|nr:MULTISPECIES: hypothetical protein [Burkholderia cepacia complex]AQT49110.1 hypothetical protein BHQ31_03235 [Burkholderia cenocepacia]MDN7734219.1 hypothetical protein [Burkholderia orbicola]
MTASSTLIFLNPFEGPPVPLKLAGILTFDPEVHFKLSGTPLPAVLAKEGMLPWYRRCVRLLKSAVPHQERRAQKLIDELAARWPEFFDCIPDLKLARNGDGAAQVRLDQMSCFEVLNRGRGLQRADLKPHQVYLEDVGAADLALVLRLQNGDMGGALALMAAHPILRRLLWPGAESAIRKAAHVNELIPLFGAMALDVHLGWMAAWDVGRVREQDWSSSCFYMLLPSAGLPGRNPTTLFFDELKRRLGASGATEIFNRIPAESGLDDISTLDRWSNGTRLPDAETLKVILGAYGLDQPDELLYAQLGCSRHIHMLGHLAQRLQAKAREAAEPQRFWPWPAYPFEFPDFESWASNRYPFWLNFHRSQNGDGTADRSISSGREG